MFHAMPKLRLAAGVIGLSAAVPLIGCNPNEPVEPPPGPEPTMPAESADAGEPGAEVRAEEIGTIRNLHRFGNFYLAGQPEPDDFERLKERGVTTVINFRSEREMRDIEEERTVENLGMTYHHLPFLSAESLTDDVFDRSRALLNEQEDEPTLIHCASAGRVGAVWLAKRVLDDGVSWDAALDEARTIGLGSSGHEQRAKEYIQARR